MLAEQPASVLSATDRELPAIMEGVRRRFLSRVSTFVYYCADAAELKILAFWHLRRDQQACAVSELPPNKSLERARQE